jgi:very-short-patch-repair endonuclease
MAHRMPEYRRNLVRELRQSQTRSEEILWEELRSRKFMGIKFRRQRPLGRYIVDFCCDECRLVVEVDGAAHDDRYQRGYDRVREAELIAKAYTVVRFTATEVETDLAGVLKSLEQTMIIIELGTPSPAVREEGAGG